MTASSDSESVALSVLRRVVAAGCDFQDALHSGGRPRIEDILSELPAEERPVLFSELLDIELDLLYPSGSLPQPDEYLQRFPEFKEEIERIFARTKYAPPRQIGDYEIIRELGQGGMGIVYEARHRVLAKRAAIKVLPSSRLMNQRSRARFHNEARAAGQLEHPHIVPVWAVGSEDGVDFFVMQYVQGRNLAQLIHTIRASSTVSLNDASTGGLRTLSGKAGPNATTVAYANARSSRGTAIGNPLTHRLDGKYFHFVAQIIAAVADALQHAHDYGIVHRDIKPSNLLLDVHAHVWVLDFGLAQIQGEPALTRTGDFIGTLRYMSPEQALAKRVIVDHRTDIYSLGVTLFELLTLTPAFDGETNEEIVRQMMFDDPKRPRKINAAVPRDLETIVLKAISKRPDDRYQTAAELRDDLQRFIDDIPIRAQPPSVWQHLAKFAKRHRTMVATAAVMWMVLSLATGVAALLIWQEQQTTLQEKNEKQRALEVQHKLSEQLESSLQLSQAERLRAEGMLLAREATDAAAKDPEKAALLAVESHLRLPGFAANSAALAAYQNLHDVHTLRAHEGPVRFVAVSPKGDQFVTAAQDCTAILWDVATGLARRILLGHTGWIRSISFSRDGQRIVTASDDGTVILWDVTTGAQLHVLAGHEGIVMDARFSLDGQSLVTGGIDGTARIWNVHDGRELQVLRGHQGWVYSVAFSPDGNDVATGAADCTARLWQVSTGTERLRFDEHEGGVGKVQFSPDGSELLTTAAKDDHKPQPAGLPYQKSSDVHVRVWNCATGRRRLELQHSAIVNHICFDEAGKFLLSAANDGSTYLWDFQRGELAARRELGSSPITSVATSPDHHWIAVAEEAGLAWLWNWQTDDVQPLAGHTDAVTDVVFTSNQKVITTSADGTAKIWSQQPLGMVATPSPPSTSPVHVEISTDGKRLLRGEKHTSSQVYLATCPQGKQVAVLEHDRPVMDFTFDKSSRVIGTLTDSGLATLWSANDGTRLQTFEEVGAVRQLRFLDEQVALVTTAGDRVFLWNWQTGAPTRALDFTTKQALQFATEADILLAWSADFQTAEVWNVSATKRIARFAPPTKSPDVPVIASVSPDGTTVVKWTLQHRTPQLWDLRNGKLIAEWDDAGPSGRRVAFSSDSSRVAIGSGTDVQVWNTQTGALVTRLTGNSDDVQNVIVNTDGSRIATQTIHNQARLWDGQSGQHIALLSERSDELFFINRSQLVGRIENGTELVIWHTDRGERLARLDASSAPLIALAVSPNGKWFVTTDSRGASRIWSPHPALAISTQLRRRLTPDERDFYQIGSEAERRTYRCKWERELLWKKLKLLANTPVTSPAHKQRLLATVCGTLRDYLKRGSYAGPTAVPELVALQTRLATAQQPAPVLLTGIAEVLQEHNTLD